MKTNGFALTLAGVVLCTGFATPAPAQNPAPPPGSPGTSNPAPGQPQPGQPQPGLPPGGLQPGGVKKPLDSPPLLTPRQPGAGPGGLGIPCPTDSSNPRKVSVRVTPSAVRSGTPVTIRATVECPFRSALPVSFSGSAPGVTDRGAGDTMVAFLNQIPRSKTIAAGALFVEATFTPQGLANTVSFNLTASTDNPRIVSAPFVVAITGNGVAAAPTAVPTNPPAGCVPGVTLNVVQSAVIGGANVTLDLTLSCAPPGGTTVQIITQPNTLLPGPPGGTVNIPAGQTRAQSTLQAARTGNGTVTVRALVSQPAGGPGSNDSVIITNN